jgi:hypothetical protein
MAFELKTQIIDKQLCFDVYDILDVLDLPNLTAAYWFTHIRKDDRYVLYFEGKKYLTIDGC